MGRILFNFHDVILWMTAMQCLFFALILATTNGSRSKGIYLLSGFLLMHAIIPLHELILWGGEFKFLVREQWPELYFVGATAYFLDGALLLLCVRAVLFEDFTFQQRQWWHLLPACAFLIFLIVAFYQLPHAVRMFLIKSERFVYDDGYVYADAAAKCLRVLYAVCCLWMMVQYQRARRNTFSALSRQDFFWLLALIAGFLVVGVLELSLSLAKVVHLYRVVEFDVFVRMGLTGYYLTFLLISLWVFTGLRFFNQFETVTREMVLEPEPVDVPDTPVDPVLVQAIDDGMQRLKPHRDADLKLDQLAELLGFGPKELSVIINRHFGMNFYEFVNLYRIQDATNLLSNPDGVQRTITEIYLASGFNSKSVFNTFFKKKMGMTPSQFRRQGQSVSTAVAA